MGAYLSEPIVEKESVDEVGKYVNCGASSMQGWRVTQEDAHNCILDFEPDASFFAVYDGHGGSEVAAYTAANLPQFLKDLESFKKGNFEEALKEAFLGFDAKLATPEVVAVLKELAGKKEDVESEDDEENVRNLYEEAEMPLEQVMAKYAENGPLAKLHESAAAAGLMSPCIRSKPSNFATGSGSSSSRVIEFEAEKVNGVEDGSSDLPKDAGAAGDAAVAEPEVKTEVANGDGKPLHNGTPEPDSADKEVSAVTSTKEEEIVVKQPTPVKEASLIKEASPVKEASPKKEATSPKVEAGSPKKEAVSSTNDEVANGESNGELKTEEKAEATLVNGDMPYIGKGKGKARLPTAAEKAVQAKHAMALRRATASALYKSLLEAASDSDSESDADETFEGPQPASSDDDDDDDDEEEGAGEAKEGEEDGDEEEEDDDDDDDSDDDEEEEDDEDDFSMKMTDDPGYDSGCTAVVAVLRGSDLYVANAGDSRCIVCRSGVVVEMSLDHKPEDQPELDRIVKAGGKVTEDGRVNGGLNLSRALGDHAYKLNLELPPAAQMITAMPDVRRLELTPEDEFMVLACDGIWNFMSSQEVCDFVRPRIAEKVKLSTICEELFDHCLAPDTMGDGTGCDNMTCVIVKFQPKLEAGEASSATKRPADSPMDTEEASAKRTKTEELAPETVQEPAPEPALV